MHNMENILNRIHTATSGSAIIVGGVAKWLNGYKSEYTRRWIDISIPSTSITQISSLGRRGDIEGGTTFPHPILEQFVIVTEDKYVLDVFVVDERPQYNIISGSNVQTPEEDLRIAMEISGSVKNEDFHNKVQTLKQLYT